MKEAYVKPQLQVQFFALSQSIAASCSAGLNSKSDTTLGKPGLWGKGACGWEIDAGTILWTQDSNCTVILGPDDSLDGVLCYNNPDGGLVAFHS